jgi:CheY-like chemotaxis protein
MTDVVMPEMDGGQLAERLCALKPDLKCLLVSEYPAALLARRGFQGDRTRLLQKPYLLSELARKLRAVLTHDR